MLVNIEVKAKDLQLGDVFRRYNSSNIGQPVTAFLMSMDKKHVHVQVNGICIVFASDTKVAVSREVKEYVP